MSHPQRVEKRIRSDILHSNALQLQLGVENNQWISQFQFRDERSEGWVRLNFIKSYECPSSTHVGSTMESNWTVRLFHNFTTKVCSVNTKESTVLSPHMYGSNSKWLLTSLVAWSTLSSIISRCRLGNHRSCRLDRTRATAKIWARSESFSPNAVSQRVSNLCLFVMGLVHKLKISLLHRCTIRSDLSNSCFCWPAGQDMWV